MEPWSYTYSTSCEDSEIRAMDVVWQLLRHETPDVQRRVVHWLNERFGGE